MSYHAKPTCFQCKRKRQKAWYEENKHTVKNKAFIPLRDRVQILEDKFNKRRIGDDDMSPQDWCDWQWGMRNNRKIHENI